MQWPTGDSGMPTAAPRGRCSCQRCHEGAPEGLDVHWELGHSVCEGSIQGVVRPPLKQRLQAVLPAVERLRPRGEAGTVWEARTVGCCSCGCEPCAPGMRSTHSSPKQSTAAAATAPLLLALTAGVMRDALGPSTSSSVRLQQNNIHTQPLVS